MILKVDPRKTGGSLAVGIHTIPPGASIPVHKHLSHDEVLFVHKGQGRAKLDGRTVTVVPGVMVYVPRQTWHGLRNTGTGNLQITWTAAPPGIEEFFREFARLGGAADAAAIQTLAQRYGIEFRPEGEREPAPARTPLPRRRHRRRRRGPRTPQAQAPPKPSAVQPRPQPPAGPSPKVLSRQQPVPSTPPTAHKRRSDPRRRHGRVKEVYMGGRWVPVSGEGPVIAE